MTPRVIVSRLGFEGFLEVIGKLLLLPFGTAGILIFYLTYIPPEGAKEIFGLEGQGLFIKVMGFILLAHLLLWFIDFRKTLRAKGIIRPSRTRSWYSRP